MIFSKLNKKGFTLIELLVVIAILALIFGISAPTVTTIITNIKNNSNEVSYDSIKKSAIMYAKEKQDNINWQPIIDNNIETEYTCVPLEELIKTGLLARKYINNLYFEESEEPDLNNISVKIIRDYNTKSIITQGIDLNTGTCSTDIDLKIEKIEPSLTKIDITSICKTQDNTQNAVAYSLDRETWYENINDIKNKNVTTSTYSFSDNIKKNTKYTIYVKCTITQDDTENNKTGTFLIKKKKVVTGNYGAITIETPSGCENEKEVTITSTINTDIQYSFDKKTWLTYEKNNKPKMTYNGTIYAKYKDGKEFVTKTITNIDKSVPEFKVLPTANTTSNSASVNYEIHNTSTCGTPTYTCKYWTDNKNNAITKIASNTNCIFENLEPATDYNYEIKVENANGNYVTHIDKFRTKGQVLIQYNVNGGTITPSTNKDYKIDTNQNILSSDIGANNYSLLLSKINYEKYLEIKGLLNYNDSNYVNIIKTGYESITGSEWICLEGCTTPAKTFNQETQYNSSDFCDASDDNCTVTLGVNWKAKDYIVTFNANGGTVSPESMTVTYDSTYGTLTTPSRTGYTFDGWYTEITGGVKVTSTTTVTMASNHTLYARWTANKYTVTYYNGTTKLNTSSHTYGQEKNLTTWNDLGGNVENSSYGWIFYGWSTATDNTTRTYTDGQSVTSLVSTNGGNINVYAIYSRTITFKSGILGATISTKTQYWNPYGTTNGTHIKGITSPTITSLSTYGWTTKGFRNDDTANGTLEYTASSTIYPSCDEAATLYAIYSRTIITYYGANKASNTESTQYYNSYGNITSVTLPSSITNLNYWDTLGFRDDTTANSKEYSLGQTYTPAANVKPATFYAIYSRTLTIYYNGNNNTGGSTTSTTKKIYLNSNSTTTSSQIVSLATNGFTRTGYTFSKWSTGSTSGTQYDEGASYTAELAYNASTFQKTLYATWTYSTLPTCTISKSNLGTQNGVSGTITCNDCIQICDSNNENCEETTTRTFTGIKSSRTYYVYDEVGNQGTCSISVSSKTVCSEYSWSSWTTIKSNMTWDECLSYTDTATTEYWCVNSGAAGDSGNTLANLKKRTRGDCSSYKTTYS